MVHRDSTWNGFTVWLMLSSVFCCSEAKSQTEADHAGAVVREADAATPDGNAVIGIGARRELFVDTHLIERISSSAELRLHSPVPREVVLVHDAPWEGNATANHCIVAEEGRIRLYYRAGNLTTHQGQLQVGPESWCVAESRDGIRFERPNLGLVEFAGSKNNNIVVSRLLAESWSCLVGAPAIFLDANPRVSASQRYKTFLTTRDPLGLTLGSSADGLTWRVEHPQPGITLGAFDSQNVCFWDSTRQEYRGYWRSYTGGVTTAREWRPDGVRAIRTGTSQDLREWRNIEDIAFVDSPTEELYENGIAPYPRAPHLFLGFPLRYVDRAGAPSTSDPNGGDRAGAERVANWPPSLKRLPDRASREARAGVSERFGSALTDILFMSSRDGVRFHRWSEAFLRPGPERTGTWNYGHNLLAWNLLETPSSLPGAASELSFYAAEGYWTTQATSLRRYTLRLDGFVSLHAGGKPGELLTRPLKFTGGALSVNFATSAAGGVRVELQLADGTPLPGFRAEDCDELFGDSVDRIVTWRGSSDVGPHAGKPVRLRLICVDADVYSFQFQ
jgi:hypothetical protein